MPTEERSRSAAIDCPVCGASSRVLETRTVERGLVRRRRVCNHGHRYSSWELVGAEFVRKRGGGFELFDEKKLRRSVEKACAGTTSVDVERIATAVREAARRAPARTGNALSTHEIGRIVLRELFVQDTSGIPAVRYGSVFLRERHFSRAEDLLEAVRETPGPMLYVIKRRQPLDDRTGGRGPAEPFSHAKLRRALERALEKTPTVKDLEAMLDLVASQAMSEARPLPDEGGTSDLEIDARRIGEIALEVLRARDMTAWARFLAVFDPAEFKRLMQPYGGAKASAESERRDG